jgi:hypothetical protein
VSIIAMAIVGSTVVTRQWPQSRRNGAITDEDHLVRAWPHAGHVFGRTWSTSRKEAPIDLVLAVVGLTVVGATAVQAIRMEARDPDTGQWEEGPLILIALVGLCLLLAMVVVVW